MDYFKVLLQPQSTGADLTCPLSIHLDAVESENTLASFVLAEKNKPRLSLDLAQLSLPSWHGTAQHSTACFHTTECH